MFGTENLEWCGYPTVKEFEDIFIRCDTIHDDLSLLTDERTGRAHA